MSEIFANRLAFVKASFEERYGFSPQVWTRAPGRVDLMGSHTDYNMGFVMTMTIDRDTWIAATPRDDNEVAIVSCNVEGTSSFSLEDIQKDPLVPWTDYIRGIAAMMKSASYTLQGFNGLVHSTVPFGSGLSSSAAIEMATAVLFKTLGDLDLDPLEMALIGQRAENEFVGVNTGILDQYSSAMGRANSALILDCRHLTSEVVSLDQDFDVVICNTCAERSLVGSEYDDRRAQCEEGLQILQRSYPDITALRDVTPEMFTRKQVELPDTVARRCQFVIEENQRVLDLAQALTAGRLDKL
jgi:galactokinase